MNGVIAFKFKKFSKIVDELCQIGNVPLYFRYVQKKTYTNYQHLFLLVAKEHTTYGYRMFVESLYDSMIPKYIKLKKIPHFTTLQKFAQRLPAKILNKLIFQTKNLFRQGNILGADSTGMELYHASSHYCKRIDRKNPVKGFVNLNMICDVKNKNIIVTKIRKKRRSDFSDFMPMFNKIKNLDFDHFVADKGFDSWRNHKAVQDAGATSQIKTRNFGKSRHRYKGKKYRNKAKREFDEGIYGQRAITESVFSSLKRKYGSRMRARKYKTQKIELLFKILSYNIERAMRIAYAIIEFLKGILQSRYSQYSAVGSFPQYHPGPRHRLLLSHI
jgi:hypothetical protein